MIRATFKDDMLLSWKSQARQYAEIGTPGISYELHHVRSDGKPVDCFLYRNKSGNLIGILNYYPVDHLPFEVKGNLNIWIHPKHQRRGIASALLDEATKRWDINFDQQRYSEKGAKFITAYQSRRK